MEAARAMPTVAGLLTDGERRLAAAGIDSARLDAEVLLAHTLGIGRAALYARLRDAIDSESQARFAAALDRRARREPVAYITGVQEFWSLPFAVSPAVLIPRPETELLVEVTCRLLRRSAAGGRVTVCDVGTGSGCVAVALARELPAAAVVAVDVSPAGLAVARRNAAAHGVEARIEWCHGDLFAGLDAGVRFDAIVSNPPYLAPGDAVSPELAFEPVEALAAGSDGLSVIRRLVATAPACLTPGGWLVVEIGAGQAARVLELARAAGLVETGVETDLAGIDRVLVARRA